MGLPAGAKEKQVGHYLLGQAVGIGLGIVIGAFMPAVGRKLKALFVKEADAVKAKL